jgi:hypothetical protein
MDPTIAALDLVKAGAVIANMIESYRARGAPLPNPEGTDHDELGQVRFNQESKERQYNLATQAKALGWTRQQIRILNGDLGHSGKQAADREDFKVLVSDVAMGQVGAIFSLECSPSALQQGLASVAGVVRGAVKATRRRHCTASADCRHAEDDRARTRSTQAYAPFVDQQYHGRRWPRAKAVAIAHSLAGWRD